MSELPISVTIIAHNEEKNLARCLASVQGWVAEIVVVINDCTDGTAAVAQAHGARVVEHAWTSYRDQKNFAQSLCTQTWVLALDADEVVSPGLKLEIETFVAKEGSTYAAAEFPRLSWFMGRWIRHGDWYPDRCLRLYRREAGAWGGADDHTDVQVEGSVATFQSDLLHYSYRDIPDQLRKLIPKTNDFLVREHNRKFSVVETVFRTAWRFFRGYVLRRGFLDGYPGFYIACANAFYTLMRYSRLYEKESVQASKKS